MKSKQPLILIFGIAAISIYLLFTLVAFLQYPDQYGPLTNWLSDLGNPHANPSGFPYYNIGCILTGLTLIAFYIELRLWNTGKRRLKILLIIAQVSGILSSCSLIISAVFPLGVNSPIHSFWSAMISVFLGFFLTFSATAFLRNPSFPKYIAYYAFITALVNFIYGAFLNSVYIAEWISIGMFIIDVFLIAINSQQLSRSMQITEDKSLLRGENEKL